jgi:hypothetical protein
MQSAFDNLEQFRSEDMRDDQDVMPDSSLFAKQLDRIKGMEIMDDDETEDELTPEELHLYAFVEINGGEDNVYGNFMGTLAGGDEEC